MAASTAAKSSVAAQRLLGVRDVERQKLGSGVGGPRSGDFGDAKPLDSSTHLKRHGGLLRHVEPPGERLRNHDAGCAGQVHAIERHGTDAGNLRLRFHQRRPMHVERQRGKRRHPTLIHAAIGQDLQIGTARQRLHGRLKGARGRVPRQVDGDDDRHAESH
jgi:hypothetical protein